MSGADRNGGAVPWSAAQAAEKAQTASGAARRPIPPAAVEAADAETGGMTIRRAAPGELEALLRLYAGARDYMAAQGNPTQWGDGYPARALVEADIADGKCFVCTARGAAAAVFYFDPDAQDPTYQVIEGAWRNDRPYGVVHRIASARTVRGAAAFCLNWAYRACGENLRIDTHADNRPMQSLLGKLGFLPCGVVHMADGSPRIAFQKCAAGQ